MGVRKTVLAVVEHGTEADGEGPVEREVLRVRDEPAPEAAPEDEVRALARVEGPDPQPEVVAARGEAEEPLDPEVGPLGGGEAQAELVVRERPVGRGEDRGAGFLGPGGRAEREGRRERRGPAASSVSCSHVPRTPVP